MRSTRVLYFSNNTRIVLYHIWLWFYYLFLFLSYKLCLTLTVRSGIKPQDRCSPPILSAALSGPCGDGSPNPPQCWRLVTRSTGLGTEEPQHQGLQSQDSMGAPSSAHRLRPWSVLGTWELGTAFEWADVRAGGGSFSVSLPRVQEANISVLRPFCFQVQTFRIFNEHLQPSP